MSERTVTSRNNDVQRRRGVVREVRLGDGMLRINNDSEFMRSGVRVGQDHLHRVRRRSTGSNCRKRLARMRRRKTCCAIDAVGGRPRDRAARAVAGIRNFNGNDGDRNLALAPRCQPRSSGSQDQIRLHERSRKPHLCRPGICSGGTRQSRDSHRCRHRSDRFAHESPTRPDGAAPTRESAPKVSSRASDTRPTNERSDESPLNGFRRPPESMQSSPCISRS